MLLLCSQRPRVQQPGWNVALPLLSLAQLRPKTRAEKGLSLGTLCPGLDPEQLAFLQEGLGPSRAGQAESPSLLSGQLAQAGAMLARRAGVAPCGTGLSAL